MAMHLAHRWIGQNGPPFLHVRQGHSTAPGLCADPGFFHRRLAHSFACVDRAAAQLSNVLDGAVEATKAEIYIYIYMIDA